MTYNVFGGTLSLPQSINQSALTYSGLLYYLSYTSFCVLVYILHSCFSIPRRGWTELAAVFLTHVISLYVSSYPWSTASRNRHMDYRTDSTDYRTS